MHKCLNPYYFNLLRIYGVKWSIQWCTHIIKNYYYSNTFSELSPFLSLFLPLFHNYITISFFSPTHLLDKAKLDN